tara:strand:- start:9401 stop:10219 length:819 start_codon:yes stop_codon:yes gene_type:complete
MADDTFIFIPKGAPFIDTGVSPSVTYQDGQIHAFDSADGVELAAAGRIQTNGAGFDVSTLLAAATGLSLGGQTKFAGGSAAAPSITTTGDLDTGIYFPAANALGFALAGAAVGRWTTTGLGLGTTSPGEILHALKTSSGAETFILHQNGAGAANTGAGLRLAPSGFAAGATIRAAEIVALNDGVNTISLAFRTSAGGAPSDRMLLTSTGLSINTTASNYTLHVNGSLGFAPGSSVTPSSNGDVVFELTSNTTFTVKAKGSDGTVRSGTVTLT